MTQCGACVHYLSPLDRDDNQPVEDDAAGAVGQVCAAFPEGIPDDIWWNHADHREPYSGDGGIMWETNGLPFPVYALDPP